MFVASERFQVSALHCAQQAKLMADFPGLTKWPKENAPGTKKPGDAIASPGGLACQNFTDRVAP